MTTPSWFINMQHEKVAKPIFLLEELIGLKLFVSTLTNVSSEIVLLGLNVRVLSH